MKSKRKYFFILITAGFLFCSSKLFSQVQFYFVKTTISHAHFGDSFYRNYFLAGDNMMLLGNVANITFYYSPGFSLQTSPFSRQNYSMPPLPFFCAMEYRNMQRFNIRVKFRAGTDADYEKLIASPHPFQY